MTLRWMGGAELLSGSGGAYYELDDSTIVYSTTRGAWSERSWGTGFNQGVGHAALKTNATTVFCGMGIYYNTSGQPGTAYANAILRLLDAGTSQVAFTVSGGAIQVRRGSWDGTVIGTTTSFMSPQRWYYFETKVVFDGSSGVVEILMDGVQWLNLTSQDTTATANNYVNQVMHGGGNDWRWDDCYVCDNAGSAPFNTYLGDVAVVRSDVTGTGDVNELTSLYPSAQRWYFPVTSAAPTTVSPTPGTLWDKGVAEVRRGTLAPAKRGTTISNMALDVVHAQGDDVIIGQWVSPPLLNQTISGTFKMYMQCREGTSGEDFASQVVIRVVSEDGTTERAVLYAGQSETADPPTSEWATTNTNRGFPRAGLLPASLTSYGCTEGDRLVVEVGYRGFSAGGGSSRQIVVGDSAGSDLPEDEITTTAYNPWIEFSGTITLSKRGNWESVDDLPSDDDGSYVYSSTVDERDLYACENVISNVGTILAATVYVRGKKAEPGPGEVAIGVKYDADDNGTADTESWGSDLPLSTGYWWERRLLEVQPDSDPWTNARWNAVQLGVKVR